MAPGTRSSATFVPCSGWDSELSDLTESEQSDHEDDPSNEPTQPERVQPIASSQSKAQSAPQPQPVAPKQGRSTRTAAQRATQDDKTIRTVDPPLPPYNQSGQSIDQIHKMLDAGLIDTDPDYQRDVVWNDHKQMNLIDSLVHNYTVPNLVFRRWFDGNDQRRVCIDGKQRLTSIKRFIAGEIPYRDSETGKKLWYIKQSPNQRRTLVGEDFKRRFLAKPLTFYDYENITPNQERAIFQRVQLGTILTPAERLQAINGPCANLVREVRKCVSQIPAFAKLSDWGKNRGKDFLLFAQIVFLATTPKAPSILPESEKLQPILEDSPKDYDSTLEMIQDSFRILARLLHHEDYADMLARTNISPVEFVMAIYLICSFKKVYSDCQMADAIFRMWESSRTKSTSSKVNKTAANKAYAEMLKIIDKLNNGKIALKCNADSTRAEDVPLSKDTDSPEDDHTLALPPKLKRSRSRAADTDDDDTPLSTLKSQPATLKKHKASHASKKEEEDSDDEMDDDAVIVSNPPARLTTKSTPASKRPTAVGSTSRVSSATTKVKRSSTASFKQSNTASPTIPSQKVTPTVRPSRSTNPNTPSTSLANLPSIVPEPACAEAARATQGELCTGPSNNGKEHNGDKLKEITQRRLSARKNSVSTTTTPFPTPGSTLSKLPTPPGETREEVQQQRQEQEAHIRRQQEVQHQQQQQQVLGRNQPPNQQQPGASPGTASTSQPLGPPHPQQIPQQQSTAPPPSSQGPASTPATNPNPTATKSVLKNIKFSKRGSSTFQERKTQTSMTAQQIAAVSASSNSQQLSAPPTSAPPLPRRNTPSKALKWFAYTPNLENSGARGGAACHQNPSMAGLRDVWGEKPTQDTGYFSSGRRSSCSSPALPLPPFSSLRGSGNGLGRSQSLLSPIIWGDGEPARPRSPPPQDPRLRPANWTEHRGGG